MRHTFYKVALKLSNGQEMPITIATHDIQNVGPLVESKKVLYNRKDYQVDGFYIADTQYTFNMPEEKYEEELTFCDIVDEVE